MKTLIGMLLLTILLLTACGGAPASESEAGAATVTVASTFIAAATSDAAVPIDAATTTPTPTAAPTEIAPTETASAAATATPTAAAIATATVTPLPAPGGEAVLPRTLYYLAPGAADAAQIWRMAADDSGASMLTNEPGGIADFDVSPADGTLAYVRAGERELVRADASGANPTLLYAMATEDETGSNLLTARISDVRWSPDGTQIAFGLNGLNLVPAEGGARQLLLANDLPPDLASRADGPTQLYFPHNWSPDGTQMLVNVAFFPEGGYSALYDMASGSLTELATAEGARPCCSPAWGANGQTIMLGNHIPGMIALGLWRADAATGAVTLLSGTPDIDTTIPPIYLGYPKVAADGFLYGWRHDIQAASPDALINQPPILHRAPLEQAADPAAWEVMGDEYLRPREVLWTPDGSGAVVVVRDDGQWDPDGGTLVWLASANGTATPLDARGQTLRWGPL